MRVCVCVRGGGGEDDRRTRLEDKDEDKEP